MSDLRFWFVSLLFEPLDQVEGLEAVPTRKAARAPPEFLRRKRELQQRRDTRHHERDGSRVGDSVTGERNQRFQTFADDIGVRQFRLVRKGFPSRVKEWLAGCERRRF